METGYRDYSDYTWGDERGYDASKFDSGDWPPEPVPPADIELALQEETLRRIHRAGGLTVGELAWLGTYANADVASRVARLVSKQQLESTGFTRHGEIVWHISTKRRTDREHRYSNQRGDTAGVDDGDGNRDQSFDPGSARGNDDCQEIPARRDGGGVEDRQGVQAHRFGRAGRILVSARRQADTRAEHPVDGNDRGELG